MNGVSQDLKLAVAVSKSGVMPSFLPNTMTPLRNGKSFSALEKNLEIFEKLTGNRDIVIAVTESELLNRDYIDQLISLDVKFVHIWRSDYQKNLEEFNSIQANSKYWSDRLFLNNIQCLKKNNVKLMVICFREPMDTFDLIDAICIKGRESAGFNSNITIEHLLQKQKNKTPNAHLITYGGVAGPDDVKKYLSLGASVVGVGTLFAASEESCLDIKTKELMVAKSKKDITVFQDSNQNALVLNSNDTVSDGFNRTKSLQLGILGKGGHIYAGHSIDGVTKIRTVKETVEYLVSKIK